APRLPRAGAPRGPGSWNPTADRPAGPRSGRPHRRSRSSAARQRPPPAGRSPPRARSARRARCSTEWDRSRTARGGRARSPAKCREPRSAASPSPPGGRACPDSAWPPSPARSGRFPDPAARPAHRSPRKRSCSRRVRPAHRVVRPFPRSFPCAHRLPWNVRRPRAIHRYAVRPGHQEPAADRACRNVDTMTPFPHGKPPGRVQSVFRHAILPSAASGAVPLGTAPQRPGGPAGPQRQSPPNGVPSIMRPFAMERWQSTYENRVAYNLSESGVHPLTLGELVELAGDSTALESTLLGYGQSNGSDELRARIAALYEPVADVDVVVTNGSAEANFVTLWRLVEPGS